MLSDRLINLNANLPKHWKAFEDDGTLQIWKYSPDQVKVAQRSIYINENFELTGSFHGKELPKDHIFMKNLRNLI